MTYPALPFENHTWRISHHQGILTPTVLSALLFAASTYQGSRDPAQEINNYLVTNGVVPPNIRGDSRQADVWRDYQQLLPELGLMHSTRNSGMITLSPAGLSYLDGGISFTDLTTIQAFRWQYPNGHNTQRSAGDSSTDNFAAQQAAAGILLKPAVFLWQVLDLLTSGDSSGRLSANEIEHFVIPARTHSDLDQVVAVIRRNRSLHLVFPSGQTKQRRNASDWIKRVSQTHAFVLDDDDRLCLSSFSIQNLGALREAMERIAQPQEFWIYPTAASAASSWSLWYGNLDSRSYPIPVDDGGKDFGSGREPDDDDTVQRDNSINLRSFDWRHSERSPNKVLNTISSVYSADLSNSAHRLHDSMVRLIAATCSRKLVKVLYDPASLDLLVDLGDQELLIEVKSATYINLVGKVRNALGQVMYYDYLRSRQSNKARRKAIALTLGIDETHWTKAFLTDYLDVDLITLKEGRLLTYSKSQKIASLIN